MSRILACAGWSQRMRSPREPTSLPPLPFLLLWEEERRLRERDEPPAGRAGVQGERGASQNKIEKSGSVTPRAVTPRARRDPSSLTPCLRRSPPLRVEQTALARSVPASDAKETRKAGAALLSLSHALSLFPSC